MSGPVSRDGCIAVSGLVSRDSCVAMSGLYFICSRFHKHTDCFKM